MMIHWRYVFKRFDNSTAILLNNYSIASRISMEPKFAGTSLDDQTSTLNTVGSCHVLIFTPKY